MWHFGPVSSSLCPYAVAGCLFLELHDPEFHQFSRFIEGTGGQGFSQVRGDATLGGGGQSASTFSQPEPTSAAGLDQENFGTKHQK